ncbi:MAG TPA: serine hydrolase [Thermoanaerobaculia bacterium]|jgi:CubicO group peptidase (beta-lactamase class C family)|nr:serine hydrolase [Thermoanaerobaculia bacterium]
MKKRLLVLFLASALAGSVAAAGGSEDLSSRLETEIPKLMQGGDIPGLSIAVIRDGKLFWSGAFGVRDLATGAPVRKDTLFEAASLSKPIVAYIALRLVDRGVLDLDTPLSQYLSYDRLQHEERARLITARRILSHSSGLPNWGDEELSLEFTPGERFGYSGEGFVYLQKVIEKLTGMPLQDLARKEVFVPLGMTRSSFVWEASFAQGGGSAVGVDEEGKPEAVPTDRPANAASSLLTTAEDYARFLLAVLDGRGLKKETATSMLSPQVRIPGKLFNPKSLPGEGEVAWGLGVGLERSGPAEPFWVWHWGDNNDRFRAWMTGSREKREGVVYFTNGFEGLSIAEPVALLAVGVRQSAFGRLEYERYDSPQRVPRLDLEKTFSKQGGEAGVRRYRELQAKSPDAFDAKLLDSLNNFLLNTGKPAEAFSVAKLYAEAHPRLPEAQASLGGAALRAGDFELAIASFEKAAVLDPKAPTREREIRWAREGLAAQRNPISLPAEAVRRFAGNYGARQIVFEAGSLFYQRQGRPGKYRLRPLSADNFWLEGLGIFRLRFVTDGDGRVTKLVGLYSDGREDDSPRDPERGGSG